MKYLVILGDGMADRPVASLGGKTPLQAAQTPYMDRLSQMGCSGLLNTIPEGYSPGSEIANLAVLGYDVSKVFEGRGSLEAASMGVPIDDGELALRCNLICVEGGRIKNHSAGHISDSEAAVLVDHLQQQMGDGNVSLHKGVSYRHLLKIKEGDKQIKCTPPHDAVGEGIHGILPVAVEPRGQQTAELLSQLILRSRELLEDHPVNVKRKEEGKDPANSIWPWSPGYRPRMERFGEKYGLRSGAVISAVDLIKGIGVYAGLEVVEVEGATGLYNTNYEGKAEAAIEALRRHDFVFLHVEASDEAGHEGDAALKRTTIEYLDRRVLKTIMERVAEVGSQVAIALLPDHPTPCELRTHTTDPVPFIIYKPGCEADMVSSYDEYSAAEGGYGTLQWFDFMNTFIG